MAYTAADYNAKVQAYFVTTLGRPATAPELSQFSSALLNNSGNVWDAGLVNYLSTQTGFPSGTNYGQIVTDMYTNLTGHAPNMSAYNFYVGQLSTGSIKLKGLANAIINDNGYIPKADGTYGQPPLGWPTNPTSVGSNDADLAILKLKVAAAATFTAALDTPAENTDIASASGYNAAKTWLAAVVDSTSAAAATSASANTAIATVSGAGSVGQTFTLTADIDSGTAFTGGSGNDTFIADETTTAKVSLADVLTGGLGTDSLTIYNSKGVAPQMSAIESVTLNTIAGDYNASTATGLTTLNVISADGTNTFTVGSGVSVSLANTAIANTGATKDDVVVVYDANATSATLTLNNVSSAGTNSDLAIKGAKIATLNIATTGAASTIDALLTATDTVVDSYVITGDKGLTITDALTLATNATTKANAITSTGLTGDLSYKLGTIAANQNVTIAAGNGANTVTVAGIDVDGSVTATFGSGKDTITVSDATGSFSIKTGDGADKVTLTKLDSKYNSTDKETASVNLGAGDDTLVVNVTTVANLASGVTLAGGDGTDTINIANAAYLKLFDNSTADVAISGFENLALQNTDSGTFDLSKVSGINKVVVAAGVNTGGGLILSKAAANSTLDWSVTDATTTSGGSVTVSLADSSGSADAFNLNATLKDTDGTTADTLTIGSFVTAKDSNSKALETLNITANATLASTSASATLKATDQTLTITSLDLTGGVTTVNVAGTASTKITGYATATTLVTVDATNSSGNNNLSVAAGTTFKGGSGNDTFTGTQAQFAALTTLTGGAGTDTVAITDSSVTTASLTIDDKAFKNTSGVEALSFTGATAGDFTWVLGGYANAMATANGGVLTATASAFVSGATGDDITIDASGMSGANALNLTLKDTSTAGAANAVTVTGSDGNDTLKITELTGAAASEAVYTVNGGAGNDTITVTATLHASGSITINGGSGDDTITGSDGVDTITGGSGNDTITSGKGADVVTGGTGADSIVLTEAAQANDNIKIAAGDSLAASYDTITGFNLGDGAGAYDTLTFTTAAASAAANAANVDGTNFGTIKSHTIASGMITFDTSDTYASAKVVNASNLADVLGYLDANITTANKAVAFLYDSNADGTADATFVFENNATADSLVLLVGVTATSLATADAAGAIVVA